MADHDPSLLAACTQCGGNVPVVLAGPAVRCEYCGSDDPLPATVRERVESVRLRVAKRSAQEQQLVGKQARLGRTYGVEFLIIIATLWLIAALFLYFMIDTPRGMSVRQLLFDVHLPSDRADDAAAKWWIIFILCSGFALTMFLYGLSLIFLRRVVRHALPMAPAAPGGAPRCRCCAADLPATGSVRRCGYCGADHLVLGERYQREERSLEQALAQIERTADKTLAVRQRRADRLARFAALFPMVIALASPVGLALGASRPDLWLIPGVLLVAAVVVFAIMSAIHVPAVRTLHETLAGDRLMLAGKVHRVSTTVGYMTRGGYTPIHLLTPQGADPAQITHAMVLDLADEQKIGLFEVRASGEPLPRTDAEPQLELGTPSRQTTDGPFADRSLNVWAHFDIKDRVAGRAYDAAFDAETVRLWRGVDPRSEERPAPTYTLHSRQLVPPDQALLLTATDPG